MMLIVSVILAAVSSAASADVGVEHRPFQHPHEAQSRWLTYACNSKNNSHSNRNLLSRILTQPCTSKSKALTTDSLYYQNTTNGSHTFVNVCLGILASLSVLFGALYLLDRETFEQVTGVKDITIPRTICWKPYCKCNLKKRRIDPDEEDATPFEQDTGEYYLTEETKNYLAEKEDWEVKRPRRLIKSMFGFCFRTKDYESEEGDKYRIPWTGSEDNAERSKRWGDVFLPVFVALEDVRLRLCWKPTKEYNPNDKYDVGLDGGGADGTSDAASGGSTGSDEDDEVIPYAASSYESAEEGTTPW